MSHTFLAYLFVTLLCIFVSQLHASYRVTSYAEHDKGFRLQLSLVHSESDISVPIKNLRLDAQYWSDDIFRMTIRDAENKRWEVPSVLSEGHQHSHPRFGRQKRSGKQYSVDFDDNPFTLTVVRNSDKFVLFNLTQLIYNDQYIVVKSTMECEDPSKGAHIYGLGERIHNLRLDSRSKTYSFWAFDHGTPHDGQPLYGSHPFMMQMYKGNFHGKFMLNSNAMGITLDPDAITYKMIGGIVDLFVFAGPEAETVLQQYHSVIGTPKMIPFWSLGNHQCRWGYKSIQELDGVVEKYASLGIPIDTAWSDIDWMDKYKDFVPDPVNYAISDVQSFTNKLKKNDRHYVVILDPGIKVEDGYGPYQRGLAKNAFVKSAPSGKNLIGKVWPGYTVYPDFTSSSAVSWWHDELKSFVSKFPVSGLWIDMNEASSELPNGECFMQPDGSCKDRDPPKPKHGFDPNNPPFVPNNMRLVDRSISLDGIHNGSVIEYNAHTLYGYFEGKATGPALEKITGKRSFVLSRSTFPGSGRYVQHWLGDNNSEWSDLFYSLSGILDFQLFGIPMVGADICGFGGNSNAELCARWIQVGAFYPFTRNHNGIDSNPQEYYIFGDQVVAIARSSLLTKYALLSYYYTLFMKASVRGGSVLRPVFFEFPYDKDPNLPYLDRVFMVGSSLLVMPVLDQGKTSITGYIPGVKGQDLWYEFSSGKQVDCYGFCNFDAPLTKINSFMRGGHSLLLHDVVEGKTTTTAQARRDGFRLMVALDSHQQSSGDIYIDDGESINVGNDYMTAEFNHRLHTENSYVISSNTTHPAKISNINTQLNGMVIYGISATSVSGVKVSGQSISSFKFDGSTKVLTANFDDVHTSVDNINIEYTVG